MSGMFMFPGMFYNHIKDSKLKMPEDLEKYEKEEIEQGYLCIKPTVRIRKANNEYTLNYKWKQKGLEEKSLFKI